jgi:hypothetical protein
MGFSSWAGRGRTCMTLFGPSKTEKIVVEARARKIWGSSRLRWVVGAERCTEGLRVSLIHIRAYVRGLGLYLNPSEAFSY